jgi:hypothetical protein
MSDLLIRGMEMPKDGEKLYMLVFSDGRACASYKPFEWHEVIPVPAHGDLIDLKAPFNAQFYDEMTEEWTERMTTVEDVLYSCMVDEMPPTVIPAEPCNNLSKPCKEEDAP